LSHAALFPDAEDRTRYASLGGKPNSKQPGLVQATIAKLPVGCEIVAAFDCPDDLDCHKRLESIFNTIYMRDAGPIGAARKINTIEKTPWHLLLGNRQTTKGDRLSHKIRIDNILSICAPCGTL